jgi:NOL1/NOP2/sun family putative RNA methylase
MNFFIERYKKLNPDFDFEKALSIESFKNTLRVNTLKISEEELVKKLKQHKVKLKKIDFIDNAYTYESEFSLASTTEYALGYFYLQELASMLPSIILNPEKDDLILDMCSAPGSKTTHISQLMNNSGIIVALDENAGRLQALRSNLLRCGCKNVIVYKKDARFAFDFNKKFDKILLDAPCSGNFAIEPDFFEKKNLQGFLERSRLQKELLKSAHRCLKPEGILVYSTCSLEPEENELTVDWFLNKFEDIKLLSTNIDIPFASKGLTKVFDDKISDEIKNCIRIWPDSGMQGFFIAKFKKI